MKVLLNRRLFLGGIMYEPSQAGTTLPDKIGDRKVVLFDPKNPPKPRRMAGTLFEVDPDGSTLRRVKTDELADVGEEQKDTIVLPRDVVAWSDKAAQDFSPEGVVLTHGHPKLGEQVPLSALTPGLSPKEREAAIRADQPANLAKKAEEESQQLEKPAVGKK